MSRRRICRSSIAAFLTLAAFAQADTFTWDPANNAAVTAIGGVWDTTTPNWLGAPTRLWPNEAAANADVALFTGIGIAPFVVNLGQPIIANGLTFDTAGYTIANGGVPANTLTLDGTTPTITTNESAVVAAAIAGTAGLTKSGAGVLILSGTNVYTGVTAINQGILSVSASENLGAATTTLSINGGALQATGALAVDLGTGRTLAIGAGDATLDAQGAGILTISGALSGALGNNLIKTGTGIVSVTGGVNTNSAFLGDITVNAGTLRFGAVAGTQYNNLLGGNNAARTITINASATLDLIGRDMFPALAGVNVNGGLIKNAGFARLGPLTLNGGTLQVVSGQAATFQSFTFESDVTVQGTAASQITGTGITNGGIHLEKAGGVTINVPDVTGNANADLTIAPALVERTGTLGAGAFTKTGTGTLVLNGANAFTGTMTVNAGIVRLGATLADAADVAIGPAGRVEMNATTDTFDQLTGTGLLTRSVAGTGTFTILSGGGSSTFGGTITGGIAITKDGGGTGTFTGANTYSGATRINDGVLVVQGNSGSIAGSLSLTVGDNNGGGETLTVGAANDVWSSGALNRLPEGTANLTLNGTGAGGFVYVGPAAGSSSSTEFVGPMVFSSGRNTVTLLPGTGNEVQLTAGGPTSVNNGTVLIRGENLGANGIGSTRLVFNAGFTFLSGADGADGTTTKSILSFAIGDNSAAGAGSGFLTHDANNGLRPLAPAEYGSTIAGPPTLRNVSVSGGETVAADVRINALRLTGNATTTIVAGTGVSITSGAVLFTGGATINGAGLLDFGPSDGIISVAGNTATTATINAGLAGTNVAFSSMGAGVNVIEIGGDSVLRGTAFVNSGTLRLGSSSALNDEIPMTVVLRPGTIFQLNGHDVVLRDLEGAVGTGQFQNGGTTPATLTTYLTAARAMPIALVDGGAGALNLAISGGSFLTLSAANTFTGATEIRTGQITLSGNGTGHIQLSSGIQIFGGTLNLRNTNGNVLTNRINDNGTVSMHGGTLTFNHNADAGTSFAETDAGAMNLVAGGNVINVDKAATDRTSVITFDSLSRAVGSTVNFTSILGDGAAVFDLGATTQSRLVLTAEPTLDNGIIGGWATTDSSATTREFAKYVTGANASVTALVAADYTTSLTSGANAAQNVKLTASPAALTSNTEINSLNLAQASGSTVNLGGNALRVESGGVIVSGNFNAAISGGTLTAGTGPDAASELIIHTLGAVANPVTIAATIGNNGAGVVALIKAGAGILTLQGATNTYTGRTTINGGTLRVDADANLGAAPAAASPGHLTLSNSSTLDVTQSFTLNGNRGLAIGTGTNVVSIASGPAGAGKVLTYNGSITGIGEGSLTFQSNATSANPDTGEINATLTAPIMLGGALRIEAGTVRASGGDNVIGRSFQVGVNGSASYIQNSGSLTIGAGIDDVFHVGVSTSDSINKVGTLDLAGASNFTANVQFIAIGAAIFGSINAAEGSVTFATNNNITASTFDVGISLAGHLGTQTLNFGSGISNITTAGFGLGRAGGSTTLNLASGGILNLNGSGQRTLFLGIGDQGFATAGVNSSTLNGSNGTVNASLNELAIARKSGGAATTTGGSDSSLVLGAAEHRIEANHVRLGDMLGSTTGIVAATNATGTISMAGGTFNVVNNLTMGTIDANQGTSRGILNLTGGTFTIGGNITKIANDRSGAFITVDGASAVLDLRNDHEGDLTNGNIELSQLVFRRGTIRDVAFAYLDGRGVTNGIAFAALDYALILRDVNIDFPMNLANANANKGGILYEAAGSGAGATISGDIFFEIARTFHVENSPNAAADLTISGSLLSNVLLTKTGLGTLLLNDTVAGPVTATAGTLGGTGSISGVVTIGANTSLAPGASPGTLTTGGLVLDPTSTSRFELTAGNLTLGGGINDLVVVNGDLTLDGTLFVNALGGTLGNNTYVLFDYSGNLFDNGLSLDAAFTAQYPLASIAINSANTQVLLAVPEPASAMSLLLGIGSLLVTRRRRHTC